MSSREATSCARRASKLGRKGDPRMHRAVAARLQNPSMSLLDALRLGGFEFPDSKAGEDMLDASIIDREGVSLQQRKNQLSRRLRIARQADQQQIASERRSISVDSLSSKGPTSLHRLLSQDGFPSAKKPRIDQEDILGEDPDAKHGAADDEETVHDDLGRMAKFHPSFHPLFPGTSRAGAAAAAAAQASVTKDCCSHAIANSIQQQLQARQFLSTATSPAASGVAIASLTTTAASIGLTLEQLAMSLSSTPNLLRVLATSPSPEAKQELCLNLYRLESKALLQKCMLLAGYSQDEAADGSTVRMQLAIKGWEREGKRLERNMSINLQENKQPTLEHQMQDRIAQASGSASSCNRSSLVHTNTFSVDGDEHSLCKDGHHVHSLNGKCGHKPVIHQPPDGPAHIDFVVGEKLECYQDILPQMTGNDVGKFPSRYKCEELKKQACCNEETPAIPQTQQQPKELPLSDLDLDGKEWNMDFFNTNGQEETLLGLIKLGDPSKSNKNKAA